MRDTLSSLSASSFGFIDSLDHKGTTLDERLLKDIASKTISISKSCKKQIANMKKAFRENNFKDAPNGKIIANV
jgi:hypothetical protein